MATDNISKGIVKHTSRDYDSIMNDFWSVVPTMTELWSPQSDSDPGVVLAKFIASCADMLGVNLDIQANEVFAPSVTQRKNAEKIFALIGYDLGMYTAAVTEVTITNSSGADAVFDFGFNGSNFCTVNAYTDITNEDRVITYNILPMTSSYSDSESRSTRSTLSQYDDVFALTDRVVLADGESCTRVAVEGELRSFNISVEDVRNNNYVITLPSQHVDTKHIWVKAKATLSDETFLETQWRQVSSTADFVTPEPLFAVTYDNYSNAQVTVSNYLNQMENYDSNYLVIYWIDCSGVIGCVGEDVLTNFLFAKTYDDAPSFEGGDFTISNLANTSELPNTYTVTGASPETAHEAYLNSRNYINTWDSLITLPDFERFLNREAGVDCGRVFDCNRALKYNLSVYNDDSLTDSQKSKLYITNSDFPAGSDDFDWEATLGLGFDPEDPQKYVFAANFQRYTAMCFAVHNDFKNSSFGSGQVSPARFKNATNFIRYKPPERFVENVKNDYAPLQAMTVDIDFGWTRLFTFFVVGQIFTSSPVTKDVGDFLVEQAKEALALYFAPANRAYGQAPTVAEIVSVIQNSDSRITYFDAGSLSTDVINWSNCDIEYFNAISVARYVDPTDVTTIRIAPSSLIK